MKPKLREKFLVAYVAKGGSGMIQVHPDRIVARYGWGIGGEVALLVCAEEMVAAGCPALKRDQVKRVRVMIREVKK